MNFVDPDAKMTVIDMTSIVPTPKREVEIIECSDWTIVKVDGQQVASGHSLSIHDTVMLLEMLGANVTRKTISDEEMQTMC